MTVASEHNGAEEADRKSEAKAAANTATAVIRMVQQLYLGHRQPPAPTLGDNVAFQDIDGIVASSHRPGRAEAGVALPHPRRPHQPAILGLSGVDQQRDDPQFPRSHQLKSGNDAIEEPLVVAARLNGSITSPRRSNYQPVEAPVAINVSRGQERMFVFSGASGGAIRFMARE